MSPAEKAFMNMEASITRAQCLARVLREMTEGKFMPDDPVLAGGIYILAGEVEDHLNAAVEVWTKGSRLRGQAE